MDTELWTKLAAPIDRARVRWRSDSNPKEFERGGEKGFYSRFVCYIEAGTVRERLDEVAPGDWSLDLTPLPDVANVDFDTGEIKGKALKALKARLTVHGVAREDVGQGDDYKAAASDAFKRAAVRFGIGHELYEMEKLWVPMTSGDKYKARPKVDPADLYERKYGHGNGKQHQGGQEPGQAPARAMNAEQAGTQQHPPRQEAGNGQASEAQRKLIYARSMNRGMDVEEMKALICRTCNITDASKLPKARVDDVLAAIVAWQPSGDAAEPVESGAEGY